MVTDPEKRKLSLYFPLEMLEEIRESANRLDRSLSWVVQQAWKIARPTVEQLPSVDEGLSGRARLRHYAASAKPPKR